MQSTWNSRILLVEVSMVMDTLESYLTVSIKTNHVYTLYTAILIPGISSEKMWTYVH